MANVTLFDQTGKEAGQVVLNDAVFGIEPNESVVFDVIISQRASLRQGTHAVKNRSAVSGGGRKPWRQKGTGRARQGSIRSPQWRGGGVVFGPTPRSYGYKLPQKVRRLALKSVYSEKVAENKFVAVDALSFTAPKTAEFAKVLASFHGLERTDRLNPVKHWVGEQLHQQRECQRGRHSNRIAAPSTGTGWNNFSILSVMIMPTATRRITALSRDTSTSVSPLYNTVAPGAN